MMGYHIHAHVTLHREKGGLCSAINFRDQGDSLKGNREIVQMVLF